MSCLLQAAGKDHERSRVTVKQSVAVSAWLTSLPDSGCCVQDIAGDLEAALSAASLEPVPAAAAASNTLALQLLPSFRLQQCLNRCALAPEQAG